MPGEAGYTRNGDDNLPVLDEVAIPVTDDDECAQCGRTRKSHSPMTAFRPIEVTS